MKLGSGTNIRDVMAGTLLKRFSRSEVKSQGHGETKCILWRMNTFRSVADYWFVFVYASESIK